MKCRQYSLETGAPPRDLLRRRVRVGEYYRIPYSAAFADGQNTMIELYDEAKDTFFSTSWKDLLQHAALDEADRIKFLGMQNELPAVDVHPLGAMYLQFPDQQQPQGKTFNGSDQNVVQIVRTNSGRPFNPNVNLIIGPNAQNGYNFIQSEVQVGILNDQTQRDNPVGGLIIKTTGTRSSQNVITLPTDGRSKAELLSFYKGSGLYNLTTYQPRDSWKSFVQYFDGQGISGMADAYHPSVQPGLYGNRRYTDQPADDGRTRMFQELLFGRPRANNVPTRFIEVGMRPNLHIGRMVFAHQKPQCMRFVHVAGNIMAQTVVFRSTAVRLMQQAEKLDAAAANPGSIDGLHEFHEKLKYLFCDDTQSRSAQSGFINQSRNAGYYNWGGSVLSYLCNAVLNPDEAVRNKCKVVLKDKHQLDLEVLGQHLAKWIKLLVNAVNSGMSFNNQGNNNNVDMFDAFEQGRCLDETIKMFMEEDPESTESKRLDIPVMYLGEWVTEEERTLAFQGRQVNNNIVLMGATTGKWYSSNATPDVLASMRREVKRDDFTQTSANIFPLKKNGTINSSDYIAVTRYHFTI